MNRRKTLTFVSLILVIAVFAWTSGDALAQAKGSKDGVVKGRVTREDVARYLGKMTPSEQKAAAKRAKELGLLPGISALAVQAPDPGGVPHYFGPYANWAFSPLPAGPVAVVNIVAPGTGYTAPVVTIDDAYLPSGSFTPADVAAGIDAAGAITGFTINSGGSGYMAPVVTITDPTGTGATADAIIGGALTGGMAKFIDKLPGLTPAGANALGQYIPLAVPDRTTYPGSDYYEIALVEFTEQMHSNLPPTKQRGYVQVETSIVTGSHYPLPGGKFGVDKPHFLGPVIVAQGRVHGIQVPNTPGPGDPRPVRIKFYNLLPTGAGGNLFLPVDETVMGAGLGPAGPGGAGNTYTQNRATIHLHGNNTVWISDGNVHQWISPAGENTPYPAGVSARNVPDMGTDCDADPVNNPGLPGGSGCQTFFYTNAQSARLQFYHDHAMGITRLNVYAGEAAGYLLADAVEQDMISGTNVSGVNPGLLKVLPPDNFGLGIPLVIQDRTWVDANTIYAQDPTWNWGTSPGTGVTGDLWYPHIYMTVQNPYDLTGTNPLGRWHYGPWFNPPTPTCVNGLPVGCVEVGPVPNPYYQADCGLVPPGPGCTTPWEPPFRPGVPNPSIPGESFMDTPIVNGTAYPYLEVEPRAYRFRVLNAANDRMFNLQLYVAADKTTPTTPGTTGTVLCDTAAVPFANCTEVKMVPVSVAPANQYADTPSGIPDPTTKGPNWIQIGTEGGFMPKPVVVPQQPIGYNLNPAMFNFGVVNQHSLFLGSAERADVVVDFSAYAGKTLILYNDSPAPVPAGALPYDFYTGDGNQLDGGGAPNTQPGYGPNTRTIMQIRVAATATTPTPDVTLANLNAVFAKTATKRGVFELTQDPIIMPQAAYSSAYNNNSFPATATSQYIQIADTQKTFQPINETGQLQPAVTLPLEMKGMHDEMGGVYDTQFGRMSGMLGLSNPLSPVHVLIPYGLASPPTDLVKGSVEGTPIGVMPDGTQIWRIFHNGVDTHTIHTHLFHTQLINRIGQDGQWYDPSQVDPIELGWKDTFRVNPLEVTYLAMRPTVPIPAQLPFEAPDSVRLIDPTLPEGATLIPPPPAGWFDPAGNAITEILNHYVNFGWEYVWHCHILSHEEMDMMHSLVFAVPPRAPTALTATWNGNANNPNITLNWTDNSTKEAQFTVQRATDANFTTGLRAFVVGASAGTGATVTYTDTTVGRSTTYWYRVVANGGPVGDLQTAGFPTMSADSVSNTTSASTSSTAPAIPAAPTNLTATLQIGPQVSLTWRDNATDEAYFVIERSMDGGTTWTQIAAPGPRNNTGNVTYVDTTVIPGNSYLYRVAAVNVSGTSAYATAGTAIVVPAIPVAPTGFTVSVVKAGGSNYTATLTWSHPGGTNLTTFTIQRATNATFTTGLRTATVAGNLRTVNDTVNRNTTYYYRIRADNNISGSSAWANALPFPIRTGP
ncbi:MAG: Spore coat protein A [Syntrophorhabdus sp. PtaU1.Bin153]|nr:MAG: Spore coat protein A [Syntrophorhabdus sp. PtaU1.Bin153]